MSELNKLREVIETNFRLNSQQTRELSAQVNGQMADFGHQLAEVSQRLIEVGRTVDGLGTRVASLSTKVVGLGHSFQTSLDQQDGRNEETLVAIRRILDHSVDIHKTTADHERRIRRLEDKAS